MTTPEADPRKCEPSAEDDESFLDDVFEEALASVQAGGSPEPSDWLAGREALRARVIEMVELAREVAVHHAVPKGPLPTVAGYEIERELGSGSMGTVFLARQRSLGGRRVALKVLPPSLGLSAQSRSRFLAEARALARVSHAGIVAVHDIVESDAVLAFAMDWIDGGSLARVVQAWRERPDDDDLEVLREVVGSSRSLENARATTRLLQEFANLARALHAVHSAGLLHRDIKPANVLVRNDGRMLLSDFGLVRDVDSSLRTRTGQYLGTLAYSSPEQMRGERELDARSDVYSLGVSLYESLTLHRPFEGRTVAELLARIETGLYQIPRRKGARLPRDLETILAKAMEPDPGRRYASAEELADDLERLLSFQPIRARPATVWTRVLRTARRNRQTVVAALLASIAVLLVATYGVRLVQRKLADQNAERAWRRAQVQLIDPRVTEELFYSGFGPEDSTVEPSTPLGTRIASSIAAYEEAIEYEPSPKWRQEIDFERSTVLLAAALADGSSFPDLDESFSEQCPLTMSFAESFAQSRRETIEPRSSATSLASASYVDRRHLGLLALLLSETDLALDAWEDVALSHPVDPLADALTGEYYRVTEQPEEAYPLLRTAFDHYPDVGFLCLRLADVALRTSRTSTGERLVELARSRGWNDEYWTERRLEADLHALRGEDEPAEEGYRQLVRHKRASTSFVHYAHFLQTRGRFAEAVRVLDVLNVQRLLDVPLFAQELCLAAESWWSEMDEPAWRSLRRCLDDPALTFGPFPAFMARCEAAVHESQNAPGAWKHIQSPFSAPLESRPRRLRPVGQRLYELAQCAEIRRIDLRAWRQSPDWIRTAHALALVSSCGEVLGPFFRWVEGVLTRPKKHGIDEATRNLDLAQEGAWPSVSGGPNNRRRAVGLSAKRDWKIAWSVPCSRSVVAKDGLVVVKDPEGDPATLRAIDLEDGSQRWKRTIGPPSASYGDTMCIVGDRVFVPLCSRTWTDDSVFTGSLACLSLRDGSPLWTWDSGQSAGLGLLQALDAPGEESGLIVLGRWERIHIKELGAWGGDTSCMVFDAFAPRATDAVVWESPIGWRRSFDMPLIQRPAEGEAPLRVWFSCADWNTSPPLDSSDWRSSQVEGITLDPGTGQVSARVSLPLSQQHAAPGTYGRSAPVLGGSGRLYLVDTGGWLYGFDLEPLTELWPRIKVSEIDRAGCTVLDSGDIVVIDPSVPWLTVVSPDGRSNRRIDLAASPREQGFLVADGDCLFLATSGDWIQRVEPTSGQVVPLLKVPGPVELSAAGRTVLVRAGDTLFACR